MKTLKDQFDEAATRLALGYDRRYAACALADLHSTVKAFRDEGFNVGLEVRPDKIGNTAFSENSSQKIIFNGEVTAEGQRIDFAAIHAPENGNKMYFRMSWAGESQLFAVAFYRDSTAGYVDGSMNVACAPNPPDEYGEDPAPPPPPVKPMEQAFREVLLHVLAKNAAAQQYNVAAGAPEKNFKVPAQIKLTKDKAP